MLTMWLFWEAAFGKGRLPFRALLHEQKAFCCRFKLSIVKAICCLAPCKCAFTAQWAARLAGMTLWACTSGIGVSSGKPLPCIMFRH